MDHQTFNFIHSCYILKLIKVALFFQHDRNGIRCIVPTAFKMSLFNIIYIFLF